MKRGKKAFLRLLGGLACVCLCGLCLWEKSGSLSGTMAREAVLYAAGLEVTSLRGSEEKAPSPFPVGKEESPEILWEDEDGIVPFHQDELPVLSATPEPNRETGPVEETVIGGGQAVGEFYVRDSSSANLDLVQELEVDPAVHLMADGRPEVLIYHTHTSEAYSQEFTGFYYKDMETRTGNQEKSVVAAGARLKQVLESMGIGVIHDTTVNDTLYNGSYSRSWEVLQRNLEEYPGIQVTIDVHRDSMTTQEGVKYKPTALVNNRKAAQCMVLTGCDITGDWGDFPDWQENLHLALRLQQEATRLYPQLMRPLSFSDSKYNMNATPGSLLIEIGTEVNTAAEASYAGELIGRALGNVLLSTVDGSE